MKIYYLNFLIHLLKVYIIIILQNKILKSRKKYAFLSLSINADLPLESIISFYQIKNRILNQVKDFPILEKIKIICCIKRHLNQNIPSKLQIQKYIDLPEYSPYLCGEIKIKIYISSTKFRKRI